MCDTITHEDLYDLALIKALGNPSVKHIQQQGCDPLIQALGYKPKNPHATGRFVGNHRLPIKLDTIRQDPDWNTKIKGILVDANSAWPRKQALSLIYTYILRDIWVPQAIAILQRRFLQWNYLPGNPGYRRRFITYNKRVNISRSYNKKQSRISRIWDKFCCITRKSPKSKYTDDESSGDWSD